MDFLGLLHTIHLTQNTWSQDGLPDGARMPLGQPTLRAGRISALEFQGVIRNMVARGQDPRPTLAQRHEVKERFTGLITDGSGQEALLVKHLKLILRQLTSCQSDGRAADPPTARGGCLH